MYVVNLIMNICGVAIYFEIKRTLDAIIKYINNLSVI